MDSDKNQLAMPSIKLRNIRKQLGLSLKDVEEQTQITYGYISKIELGQKKPSDSVLKQLAKVYNIDEFEIFSLYERVPKEYINTWAKHPELRELLTRISLDERLDNEDKTELIQEFQDIYKRMLDEKNK